MSAAKVLYVVACAAPPSRHVDVLVRAGRAEGWDVAVVATPSALAFLDVPALEELTGHVVRSEYKRPGGADVLPPADAMIAAPVTVNTLVKWSLSISDTLALGLLTEAIGKRLPLVALPFVNRAQAAHPAFGRAVGDLRDYGVHVLLGEDVYPLHELGTGSAYLDRYPWLLALRTLGSPALVGPRHERQD